MLPDELLAKVFQHLDLEDLVALSYTNTQWRDSIPESLYETKLRRHCPSFLPHNTSRQSWQECARVHVARLKDPDLKKNLEACLRGGKRVTVKVHKNVPPPEEFVSFLPADSEVREGKVQVFPGHSAKIKGSYVQFYADKEITTDDLTTKSGTNIDMSHLENSDLNETRVVKSHHSIALTTATSHGTRDDEEGTCQVVFSTKNNTLVYSATDANIYGRMYPFVGDQSASAACYREPSVDDESDSGDEADYFQEYVEPRAKMSFMTVQGDEIEHLDHTLDLPYLVHSIDTSQGDFGWYDGLLIGIDYISTSAALVRAHFYDLERKIHTHNEEMWIGGCFLNSSRSLDGRYIYFSDFNLQVRTVWDLQTNTQHYIEPEDRDYLTLVGLLDGKLTVYTYDKEYMSEIVPEVKNRMYQDRRMNVKEAEEEHDERSIFDKAREN